jgi:multiple sugar transport system substrate-binding protein
MKRLFSLMAVLVIATLMLSACGTPTEAPTADAPVAPATEAPSAPANTEAPAASGEAVEVRYVLWDSNQQPAYEACAAKFTEANPGITIKVEQYGWNDYWNNLQTGFAAGTAPDVFTNHLVFYPEYSSKGQILDIQPMVDRDGVKTDVYLPGLADLWTRDGKRYGLPKDWDTIAVVYNAEMFEKAGLDPAVMKDWTWNPTDGGSYTETIAKLTLDDQGRNGLDPAFDKTKVVQYGLIYPGAGGMMGQTEWSMYAASNGWTHTDKNPWGTKFNYDDPKFVETIQWYYGLVEKGYAPPLSDITSNGGNTLFLAAKGAMLTDGSWMIGYYASNATFKFGFGLLPVGPVGGRRSMFNGLADSIYSGTQHPDEAWQWVKFLGSADCQNIVGSYGVVFPAMQSGVDAALKAYEEKGLDVSAYTSEASEPGVTFLAPVADHASEIGNIIAPALETIMQGAAEAETTLKDANAQINALFK